MGLLERRKVAEIQEKHWPAFQQKLNNITGKTITANLVYDTLPDDISSMDSVITETLDTERTYNDQLYSGLLRDMAELCSDDFGKKAFHEAVDQIEIRHTSDSGKTELQLSNKKLVLTYDLTNGYYTSSFRGKNGSGLVNALSDVL